MRENGFVAEDAVERGAADAELTRGAELVAVVQIEDVLDVLVDHGVKAQVLAVRSGLGVTVHFKKGGDEQIFRADDAVGGFEQSGFKHAGELTHIAWPAVLEQACERTGAENDGTLLVAAADAVEKGLCKSGDVFFAIAQGRDGEADGGETEGEVGHEQALPGHLAERGFRGGDEDSAAGGAILESFEYAEQKALAGRSEEIDAVEVEKAGDFRGVGFVYQPLARVAALEG